MESGKQAKSKIQYVERDAFAKNQNNPIKYAQEICKYAIERKLQLLEIQYKSMKSNNPRKMTLYADINHHRTRQDQLFQVVCFIFGE